MFEICLCNLQAYNKGITKEIWLDLPFTDQELEIALNKIGINQNDKEFFISNYENDFDISINADYDIKKLNKLVDKLENTCYYNSEIMNALIDAKFFKDYNEALDNVNSYELFKEIKTFKDLGYYKLMLSLEYEVPEYLENHINFESWGEEYYFNHDGKFTKYGWLEKLK